MPEWTTGAQVGPYVLLAPIGAGGMGEVWKARDPRLDRIVAIKTSREQFSERFEREARAIAALNHPNICQLYDVGENYLVMELVDGESPKGPLPLDDALLVARQIADALEAAHEKGIIHRDLKPANIKVKPDGTVKVLDFGLAKSVDQPTGDSQNSPTITMSPTRAGIILGTAPYMSPEQARGKPLDRRCDIWAFGVVLYELLTGKRIFEGEDLTETLASVVKDQPDLSGVPVRVQRLLFSCLEKDPKKRLRDIGDVWRMLDVEETAPSQARLGTRLHWAITAALGIVTVALAAGWWLSTRPAARVLQPMLQLDVDLGADVALDAEPPVLSPDGTHLVYVSRRKLFVRRLDRPGATELPGALGATVPFFSPDGKWVGFHAGGKLKKVSIEGGQSAILCNSPPSHVGATWGEDGIIASLEVQGPLYRVPPSGGTPTPLTALDQQRGEVSHRWPQVLPGGKAILFTANSATSGWDPATIEVMSLADHRRKTLHRGATFGRYLPSGHLIFVSHGTLFAAPFDPDRLEMRGAPAPVLQEVEYSPIYGLALFGFAGESSGSGMFVYRSGHGGAGTSRMQWRDRDGKVEPLPLRPGLYFYPRMSPDGHRVALTANVDGAVDLYVYELRREILTRLTIGGQASNQPVWSPDGQYVLFASPTGIFWIRPNGGDKPEPLIEGMGLAPNSFSPDGKRLMYTETAPSPGLVLKTAPIESDSGGLHAGKPDVYLNSRFNERDGAFSPDGRWIAYMSDESGTPEIYVRSFPDKGGKIQISSTGGTNPMWSRTAKELFFRDADRIMVAGYAVNGESFVPEKPRPWADARLSYGLSLYLSNFDPVPDGKRILEATVPGADSAKPESHLIFLMNFYDELARKAPVSRK